MQIHPMWATYPDLQPELQATLELIQQQIKTDNQPVNAAILDLINAGGKLLRPAYCLLFSQFKPTDRSKMIALAAAIETLHTATLIHDDVIDQSPIRRGVTTIQTQFDLPTAVYAGGLSLRRLLPVIVQLRQLPAQCPARRQEHGRYFEWRTRTDGHPLSLGYDNRPVSQTSEWQNRTIIRVE